LAAGTTVICDGARPVALAGVMGGLESEVTASTTDVLLEVAVFAPRFVRRVRRAVNLSTDASYRYERGVDAGDTLEVARTAAALIAQVAGGQVVEFIDVGGPTPPPRAVTVRPSRVARVLGIVVADLVLSSQHLARVCLVVIAQEMEHAVDQQIRQLGRRRHLTLRGLREQDRETDGDVAEHAWHAEKRFVFIDREGQHIRCRVLVAMLAVEVLHVGLTHDDHPNLDLANRFGQQHGRDHATDLGVRNSGICPVVEFDAHASRASSEIRYASTMLWTSL
jgi:hypothetical protein